MAVKRAIASLCFMRFLETFLKHQSIVFGCLGFVFAAITIVAMLYARKLELFANPSRASPAAGPNNLKRSWIIAGIAVLIFLSGWVGASFGRGDPVEANMCSECLTSHAIATVRA